MIKKITILGFLLLFVAFNSFANDSDRIEQLEKEIQELNHRISKLEALLSNPSTTQENVKTGEGWKSIANWRKLTTGMSTSDVRKILGEPHRVDGGVVEQWYYQNAGILVFGGGELLKWSEP